MPVSPSANTADLISLTILVEGNKISDQYRISEVEVNKAVNRIPYAKITLLDGSAAEETFAISESDDFIPGKAVEIRAGYAGEDAPIFQGVVVKHGIRVLGNGQSFLLVSCMDKAAVLTIGRKSTLYLQQKDSDVIGTLLGDAGLQADVAATGQEYPELVRYYATDWDFIVARAEANGLIVLVEAGKVSVKAPDVSSEPELIIRHGDALQTLRAEIDARTQLPSVKCSSWDFSSQSLVSGDSSEPGVNAQGNLSGSDLAQALGVAGFGLATAAPEPQAVLTAWASAQLLKSRLARIRGTVAFDGNAGPRPGQLIELAGVGARFNGKAFVSGVTQRIEPGSWTTEVDLGLSPRWFVEEHPDLQAPSAAALLPGIHGLHLAKVKKIDEDPDGQTRIQVEVPLLESSGSDGIWARLASGYATQNAGIFFMPEVGDEVVLGFINNDPRFPLILGSLYSSQNSPPYTPDADNTRKAIVTKGQIKIILDDEKKDVRIETPGGHSITLSDDQTSIRIVDSSGNKIGMTSSAVTVESVADLVLKAAANVKIEAGTALSAKAGTDLTLEGLNVNATANVGFKAQGQAQAELSAAGQTTVKGAIVMIN